MELDLTFVDEAVARHGTKPEAVIPILQALQEHYRWLPPAALERVCELTRITPAAITGVATFYGQFRHQPAGRHLINICHGTACHVKGAELVHDAFRRHLKLEGPADTDAAGIFTLQKVACLGCCTLAPAVQIDTVTYGHLTPGLVPAILRDFLKVQELRQHHKTNAPPDPYHDGAGEIRIGLGSCCVARGSGRLQESLETVVRHTGIRAGIKHVGCVGMCHQTPLLEIIEPGGRAHLYAQVRPEDAAGILLRHFPPVGLGRKLATAVNRTLDRLLSDDGRAPVQALLNPREAQVETFLGPQRHLATEHCGRISPLDFDEYLRYGGFEAFKTCLPLWLGRPAQDSDVDHESRVASPGSKEFQVLNSKFKVENSLLQPPACHGEVSSRSRASSLQPDSQSKIQNPKSKIEYLSPEEIIKTIEQSGLRGRGGAGFPTGKKWAAVRSAAGEPKYLICNGDEGDPGAFMDRMLLESYPYRVLEGMMIAAVAVGAHEGYLYIRAEYPLAVRRLRAALETLAARGLLGENILGSGFNLQLHVAEGAGAFVCGEETALLAALEGRRGMPRLRPPFPAETGLRGRPTLINNVETYALAPWIIRHGPAAFAALGTPASRGTKVFALAGKVRRGGLIEVPMGLTLRQVVEEIGGGVPPGRRFKAVQVGGPSGGCVPAELAHIPIDYEQLTTAGAIMGSGGLVVLDDHDCMVDIARYFLEFTQNQSCGKCTFCRVGTRRMLDILERICTGGGQAGDLGELENLGQFVQQGSLCALGRTAPNPVLSTLKYFRGEYEAHLQGRCPAGKCKALIRYRVNDECIGCTRCAQLCPADAIPMKPYEKHEIDAEKCIRCGTCKTVCPTHAVEVI